MRLVILESPFAGDTEGNIEFARRCMKDCLARGEAPIAGHLLYTQPGVLDDGIEGEREHGIAAHLAWSRVADACVAYTNRGITSGMAQGINAARALGIAVEYRVL